MRQLDRAGFAVWTRFPGGWDEILVSQHKTREAAERAAAKKMAGGGDLKPFKVSAYGPGTGRDLINVFDVWMLRPENGGMPR